MDIITNVIPWVQTHWLQIVQVYTQVVGLASIVVALTPSLKDDDVLKSVVRFLGKYVALNTNKGTNPNA